MAVPVPPAVKKRQAELTREMRKNYIGQNIGEQAAIKRGAQPNFLPMPKTAPKMAPSGPLRARVNGDTGRPVDTGIANAIKMGRGKKNGFDMNKIQRAAQNRVTKKVVRKGAFKGLQKKI